MSIRRSYMWIWISIVVLWMVILIFPNHHVDFQFHDTYAVLGTFHLAIAFTFIFGIMAGTYQYLERYPFSNLGVGLQLLLHMAFILLFLSIVFKTREVAGNRIITFEQVEYMSRQIVLGGALLFISFILFLFNLVYAVLRAQYQTP